jgi:UDP-N-acetylmuramate-alanine ligase
MPNNSVLDMVLNNMPQQVHFIGVGGVGMS